MPYRENVRIQFHDFEHVSHQIINIAHHKAIFSRAFHPRMMPCGRGRSWPSHPINLNLNYCRPVMAWVAQFLEAIKE